MSFQRFGHGLRFCNGGWYCDEPPFQGSAWACDEPRALPWAGMNNAFGVETVQYVQRTERETGTL